MSMSAVRFRFKLVLVGEGAVGKTSIRQKYMGKGFKQEYLKTIGADFASKVIEMTDSSGDNIKSIFQIWDLAGQIEFKEVRASFYGGCQGVLLVFDLTRKDTMDKLKDWILEAAKNAGGSIKGFYLIGNKSDLPDRVITPSEGKEFASFLSEKLKFSIPYIETSARTGANIDYLFQDICRTFLLKEGFDIPEVPKPEELVQEESAPEITEIELPEDVIETEDIGITPPPVPAAPSIPKEIKIPKIPVPSPVVEADPELINRLSDLEERVSQIEKILKNLAQLLKDLI